MQHAASHPERPLYGYLRALSGYWPVLLVFLSLLLSLHAFWQATGVIGAGLAFAIFSAWWKKQGTSFSWTIPEVCLSIWIVVELFLYAQSSLRFNSDPILLWTLHGVLTFVFIKVTCSDLRNKRLLAWTLMLTGSFFLIRMIRDMFRRMSDVRSMDYAELSMFKNSYAAFDAANELAVYIFALLGVAVPLAVFSRYRLVRILSWICITVMSYCLVLGFSRGGYIGFFLFLLILVAGVFIFQRHLWKRVLPGLFCAGIATGLASIPLAEPILTTMMMNETISQQRSTESRFRMWETAEKTFDQHPWTGVGTYNFNLQYNGTHAYTVNEAPIRKVTSILTQIVTERGMIGLILFSAMLCILFYTGIRVIQHQKGFDDETLLWVIASLAALVAICAREATMSSILFKNVFFHVVCIVLSLYMVTASSVWPPLRIKPLVKILLVVPFLVLLLLVAWNLRMRGKVIETNQEVIRLLDKKQWEKAARQSAHVLQKQEHPILFLHHASVLMACDQDSIDWESLFACKGVAKSRNIVQNLSSAAADESRDETLRFAAGWYAAHGSDWVNASLLLAGTIRDDSSKAIYPLCYGIVLEKQGRTEEAMKQYAHAMFLDPDLNLSPFYQEFTKRNASLGDTVLLTAMQVAKRYKDDPIAMARLGALQYFAGNHAEAKIILTQVREDLPMMNRPYYYLGELALMEGDSAKAEELWRLSVALSPMDHLVCARLATLTSQSNPQFSARMLRRVKEASYAEPLQEKRTVMYREMKVSPNATLTVAFMKYVSPAINGS